MKDFFRRGPRFCRPRLSRVTWHAALPELVGREERDELEEQVGLQGHLVGEPLLERLFERPRGISGNAVPPLRIAPVHVVHAARHGESENSSVS